MRTTHLFSGVEGRIHSVTKAKVEGLGAGLVSSSDGEIRYVPGKKNVVLREKCWTRLAGAGREGLAGMGTGPGWGRGWAGPGRGAGDVHAPT